ncbi:DUF4245 domain-containing protein [Streptomyces sp. T-3]|nr:DUF4245 domain-containing protein [Streptomyces sp. T-3]
MKGTKNVRNMLQSLAVVGVVVAAIYVFIPHDETQAPVKAVDYRVELLTARRAAPYPVLAPEGLAKDWKATSVRYKGAEGNAWHLGFHAPDGQYVAVEQSTETPRKFIGRVSQSAEKTSDVEQIDGETWTRYQGDKYDALVREDKDKGATTVVTGSGSFERLMEMAKALKA